MISSSTLNALVTWHKLYASTAPQNIFFGFTYPCLDLSFRAKKGMSLMVHNDNFGYML